MSSDLYRKEAFQSKMKGFSNPVTIRGSLSATLMSLGLLALIGGLAVYGWTNPYTRKVTTAGFVAPKSGNVAVTSPSGGVVRLEVANGEEVEEGALLAVVTDTLGNGEEASDTELQLAALRRKLELVDERIALSERRLRSIESTYALRIENAERRQESRERIAEMQARGHDLAKSARDRAESLHDKGLNTQSAVEEAGTLLIQANQQLVDAEAAAVEARDEIETTRIDRRVELNSLEEELIGYRTERLTLENEIDRLEADREREIRAPVDGTVTLSGTRDYERVQPEQPLFTVDPADDEYVATLFAPSSAIGFVSEGDTVGIRYDAYPYREHGVFTGEVTQIDATAQLPAALGAPIDGAEPVYRLRADITQRPVGKGGTELKLVSGMLLEATITVDEKPILFWLLDPVL